MAADKELGLSSGSDAGRLRWLLAVIVVMALLTAGWPLVSSTVASQRPLAAGSRLTVGPGHGRSATVTVGPGWFLQSGSSDPRRGYSLQHGPVRLSIFFVALASGQTPLLPAGLRRMVRLGYPGVVLGELQPITTAGGYRGLTGKLSDGGRAGVAAIFPGPARAFAIEMITMAPRRAARTVQTVARPIVLSLRFPAPR